MDGVNNAFCMSKEEYEIARLATKCAGLQGKIDDQAAEIGVLKIAHEAHQTNNLKMLAVLKKQAAEIENLQSLWTIAHNERSEAMLELAKERSACDQLGNALKTLWLTAPTNVECNNMSHPKPKQHRYDETFPLVGEYNDAITGAGKALEAWRALK